MLFDELCKNYEHNRDMLDTLHIEEYLRDAKLFIFEESSLPAATAAVPELAEAQDNFFLPFPVSAVEVGETLFIIIDEPKETRGLLVERTLLKFRAIVMNEERLGCLFKSKFRPIFVVIV